MDGALTGTITLGQCGPESNGNEGVLYIPQSFRTGALSSDDLVSYPGHLFGGWEGVFYTSSPQSNKFLKHFKDFKASFAQNVMQISSVFYHFKNVNWSAQLVV